MLMNIDIFPSDVRRRIKKIQKGWSRLTAFYGWENAPATNNALENYYSCSCKQIKKKQHRRNTAMKRQWKLYAMRRAGLLKYDGPSLFDVISILIPFRLPTWCDLGPTYSFVLAWALLICWKWYWFVCCHWCKTTHWDEIVWLENWFAEFLSVLKLSDGKYPQITRFCWCA